MEHEKWIFGSDWLTLRYVPELFGMCGDRDDRTS